MDQKGQTTIEYIMMVAGILMLTVIVYTMIRGGAIQGGKDEVNKSYAGYLNATNTSGYV